MAATIAVSSWSLHRTLGVAWWDSPDGRTSRTETWGPGSLDILDFPAAAAGHGIHRIHLCHFHVADRGPAWIAAFREKLAEHGVVLSMLLIDDGDLTDTAQRERTLAWTGGWIDTAAELGALSARVIAGKQKPTPESLRLACDGLAAMVRRGRDAGVRVVTENWLDLLSTPDAVETVMTRVNGLGFLADFGNWSGEHKYDDLARIMRFAEDTHAKAAFSDDGAIDGDDFARCLAVCADAGYAGPYTLIYEGNAPDEWQAVGAEADFVRAHFARDGASRTGGRASA